MGQHTPVDDLTHWPNVTFPERAYPPQIGYCGHEHDALVPQARKYSFLSQNWVITTFSPFSSFSRLRGARLIAAPTPRRRHLTQRGASRRRRQNRRELAARPRQQKHQPSTSPSLLVSSRLVAGAHARDVRSCRRVRSAKDDSNREPVGAAAARGGKTHDAHLMEMLRLWHLLI